ncbi:MAG: hypothetical protein WCQ99_00165 [Pseudomonadota bacterium]
MKRCCNSVIMLCVVLLVVSCGKKGDPGLPITVAPQPVKKFQVVARAEAITLLWRAPDQNADDSPLLNLSGFKVFRSAMPIGKACLRCPRDYTMIFDYDYKGPRGQVPEKKLFYYQDTDVAFKNLYTYKIYCYDENEVSGQPTKPIDVYWDVPYLPPSGLKAERKNKAVALTWNPPAALANGTALDAIEGYNVYRSVKQGDYAQEPENDEAIKDAAFEDIPENMDTTYFYTVRAVRKVRETMIESAPAHEIEVAYLDITPPGAPRGLTAIPENSGVLLKWIPKAEKDFAGFNVYKKNPDGPGFIKLNEQLLQINSWTDTTAKLGKRYVYGVTSVDRSARANESEMSELVEVLYILK